MRSRRFLGLGPSGFHEVAYWEWGAPDAARTVICVHGLTRNGRDFDRLAASLAAAGCRVVCPDVVGRGASGRLSDPAGYAFPQYLADLTALLARLDVAEVDWVGTSMGGILGMLVAADAKTPIRRLVLNDVGALIPKAALERLATYVGADARFADLAELEGYLRDIYASFGPLNDAEWRHLAEVSARPLPEGAGLTLNYDPAIDTAFKAGSLEDINLWAVWERVSVPTLLLRGAESDLLLRETATAMAAGRPTVRLVEIPGCGHAPALMAADQISHIDEFLGAPD